MAILSFWLFLRSCDQFVLPNCSNSKCVSIASNLPVGTIPLGVVCCCEWATRLHFVATCRCQIVTAAEAAQRFTRIEHPFMHHHLQSSQKMSLFLDTQKRLPGAVNCTLHMRRWHFGSCIDQSYSVLPKRPTMIPRFVMACFLAIDTTFAEELIVIASCMAMAPIALGCVWCTGFSAAVE